MFMTAAAWRGEVPGPGSDNNHLPVPSPNPSLDTDPLLIKTPYSYRYFIHPGTVDDLI